MRHLHLAIPCGGERPAAKLSPLPVLGLRGGAGIGNGYPFPQNSENARSVIFQVLNFGGHPQTLGIKK